MLCQILNPWILLSHLFLYVLFDGFIDDIISNAVDYVNVVLSWMHSGRNKMTQCGFLERNGKYMT